VEMSDPDNIEAAEAAEAPVQKEKTWDEYQKRAEGIYKAYRQNHCHRFDWLGSRFFLPQLADALRSDTQALHRILESAGQWQPAADTKLQALRELLKTHRNEKLLVFTQFADTALYLHGQLRATGMEDVAVLTNQVGDPVTLARRFSPSTNGGLAAGETALRVLIATDVLAEGQNLQDAHIVVNYDLPWAIVRLIQRAGRVDRIGQKHDTILIYSFWPAEGVENIIRLRQRLVARLQQHQEVIGSDDSFFGEAAAQRLRDLYTEKAGTLDDEGADEDIDLASLALQVWNSASAHNQKAALALPLIASATRALSEMEVGAHNPPGVVTYLRYPDGADALIRVDEHGSLVSQSLSAIFRDMACPPETPALERTEQHYELVARCVEMATQEHVTGGHLGSLRSVRRKLWYRLNGYRQQLQTHPNLFSSEQLQQLNAVLDLIWHYPLKNSTQEAISRQMRLGIADPDLFDMVARRAAEDNLCEIREKEVDEPAGPHIICSLGLVATGAKG
jgi:hypothetical protein